MTSEASGSVVAGTRPRASVAVRLRRLPVPVVAGDRLGLLGDERSQPVHRVDGSLIPERPEGLLDGRAGQSRLFDKPMF